MPGWPSFLLMPQKEPGIQFSVTRVPVAGLEPLASVSETGTLTSMSHSPEVLSHILQLLFHALSQFFRSVKIYFLCSIDHL